MASPIPIRFAYQIVSSSDGGPYYSWSAVGRQGISVFESRGAAGNIMVCIRRCTNTTAKENAEKTGKQKRRTRKHRADIATNPKNVSTKKRGGMEDWKGGRMGRMRGIPSVISGTQPISRQSVPKSAMEG
jgi:hypothetical protein